MYRQLTDKEIATLTVYGCSADNWKDVEVAENFSPHFLSNVHFSGKNKLGTYNKVFELPGGFKKHAGINNCCLHNCEIGNDVFIDKIHNYVANYKIDDGSYIENVNLIMVDGDSSFGNGVQVPVMNEGGGREVPIYNELSAPLAYILTLYRHRKELIQTLQHLIDDYATSLRSTNGYIGKNTRIVNCGSIINVHIGDNALLEGASLLQNGSINSNASAPIVIGAGVKCNDFILCSGVSVTDSTLISRCFVGQGCILGKHFSAIDSLFFSNCQGFHGEATAIFAGPYTVTHHKSTLLLAGMFSFLNAGSGSNQSNHMYKLGPIHQGVCERGSKTTSDSYLLWPARIGAFTLVMGRHYKHSDTSNLPFSYLIESADESILVPGVNLRSVGTVRDAQKWPKRDNRKDSHKIDPINFNLLSPYTIGKMMKGLEVLNNLKTIGGEVNEFYNYQNCSIKNSSLHHGIDLYSYGINKFLGNSLISRLQRFEFSSIEEIRAGLNSDNNKGLGEWIDLSGLIAPKNLIDKLLDEALEKKFSLSKINKEITKIHTEYYELEWTWAKEKLETGWGKSIKSVTIEDLVETIEVWKKSVVKLDKLIYYDANKEFNLNSKTGFGIDGDNTQKQQDFESVRGSFENNPFVLEVQNHIKNKTELGNQVIESLKKSL